MLEKHSPEEIQKYASRLQSDQTILEGEMKKLRSMKLEPDDAASVQELNQLWSDYQRQHQQIAALNQQGDLAAAAQLLNGASDKQFLALKAQIQKLIKINHEDTEAASAEGDRLYADAQLYIWSLIALSLLLVAFAAWSLGNLIRSPLHRLMQQAEKVADGDLRSELDYDRFHHDEIGTLARAFGRMQEEGRHSQRRKGGSRLSSHVA